MSSETLDSAKPAGTEYPILPLIAERWSPRAFSDRPVESAVLRTVLEAARWAPSEGNEQPWRFFVATPAQPQVYSHLLSLLMDGNIRWAQRAPVLIFVAGKLYKAYKDHPPYRSRYDVGLAVGALMVQASALGLVTHNMGGYHVAKAREELGLGEDYEPIAAIALGYPGEAEHLPEDLRQRERQPRTRRPLSDFVFADRLDQASPLVTD